MIAQNVTPTVIAAEYNADSTLPSTRNSNNSIGTDSQLASLPQGFFATVYSYRYVHMLANATFVQNYIITPDRKLATESIYLHTKKKIFLGHYLKLEIC